MMQIGEENFDNDGEVDCGCWHKETKPDDQIKIPRYFRLSIRRVRKGLYEAYRYWHSSEHEEVVRQGTLKDIVNWVSSKYPEQKFDVRE